MANVIQKSALWAAYGDALGFISEMTDSRGLRRRIGSERLTETVSWTRMVGGKFGALAEFPSGTYSDDTQLRLATSRSIDGLGHFDVEAFAKVELPVWLSYSLGAGVGSKAAANNLTKPNVAWFSNFFSEGRANYMNSGGNGAAMRIQPHVWIAQGKPIFSSWIKEVLRNTICTHGHPRGIAGAVFHALCLKWTLDRQSIPSPLQWLEFCDMLTAIPTLIADDGEMASFWLPAWQSKSSADFGQAMQDVSQECVGDVSILQKLLDLNRDVDFGELVNAIHAGHADFRGSGTKTSLLAAAAAWMHRADFSPNDAIVAIVNVLDCDTDSIATMTGALLGCVMDAWPQGAIQDKDYLMFEADRLNAITDGRKPESFKYPDLLRWQPPRTQSDAVSMNRGHLFIEGFGTAHPASEKFASKSGDAVWQWLRLSFDQTILAKQRPSLDMKKTLAVKEDEPRSLAISTQETLFSPEKDSTLTPTLHDLTNEAIQSSFDATVMGNHILMLTGSDNGIELSVAYIAIVAKARLSRRGVNEKFSKARGAR